MLAKAYLGLGAILISGYSYASLTGYELTSPSQQIVGKAEHADPNRSYRSFYYWFPGFRGGK